VTMGSRIGIFGGTFDPVHVGHLIVAAQLRFALHLDSVLIVPAGKPPHKSGQEIADNEHRLAMLRLAIDDDPLLAISTLDFDRGGPSYTADTLALLHAAASPAATLVFLMGQDSFRDFPSWDRPNAIARLAEIGVALRPGTEANVPAILAAVPAARGRVRIVPVPLIDVSSRDIRRRIARGEPISYQVPPAVERYISAHGLYRSTPGWPVIQPAP